MNKLLIGLAMAAVASTTMADAKLTGFKVEKVSKGVEIHVQGDELGTPKVVKAWGGKSYILEFSGKLMGKPSQENVNIAGVEYVKSAWYSAKPPRVRVLVRLDPTSPIALSKSNDGYKLLVETPKNATAQPVAKETKAAPATPAKDTKVAAEPKNTLKEMLAPVNVSVKPLEKESPLLAAFTADDKPIVALPAVDGDVNAVQGEKKAPAKQPAKKPEVKVTKVEQKEKVATTNTRAAQGKIDFEFVDTKVVHVLRAIAMQADVNIITAPDVQGEITISLHDVSVNEALNMVTILAGLHYAKVGNTYVVAKDPELLRKFGSATVGSETMVVPIYSGESQMVKSVVERTLGNSVDVVLPSETIERNNKKDSYVMLIGSPASLAQAANAIRQIDKQLCAAHGIEVPISNEMVRKSYRPYGTKADTLVKAIADQIGNVEVFATPADSTGEQVISLYGRVGDVDRLLDALQAIDQVNGGVEQNADQFTVYEVKFLDPRGVKQDLERQYPGIQVTLVPATAGAPGLYKEVSLDKESGQSSGNQGGVATEVKTESGSFTDGITLPFNDLEKQAYSMRIVLRGNTTTIQKALAYLGVIDVEPRQLALELRVMDLTREDGLRVGIDWGALTGGGVNIFRVNQGIDGANIPGTASSQANLPGGKALNITATLDQLANDRNLIARPNLFAYDGRQAELFVGDVIRYVESIQSTQNGTTVTSKELPVGVRLAVLPRIGGDGKVTLDLRPVVSTLNGFTNVPGGGQLPQTSLRIAQNTLTMEDGETIAIGGLIQDTDVKRLSGIPILKDIPILGKLFFSRTDNNRRRTELVFFLTVRVVNKDARGNAANPHGHGISEPTGG